MIRFNILFLMMGIFNYAQVGILTDSPTKVMDVNGDARVRILNNIFLPDVSQVLTTDNNGVLQKATPIDVLYSSGLYTRQSPNDYWTGIYVGNKACRLDFIGRFDLYATDFTFSVFYEISKAFKVISQNIVTVAPIDATSFNINFGGTTYLFQFTLSGNTVSVHAVKTSGGGYWSQGTFRSIPIMD